MHRTTRTPLLLLLTAAVSCSGVTSAWGGVISTQQYLTAVDRDATIAHIDAMLARDDVRRELERLGVDPVAASGRVAAMTDQELQTLATKMDNLPAGGEILAVIGIVFIVLLILDLTGVIHIFKRH